MREQLQQNNKKHADFTWDKLGDICEGRQVLGEEMPVLVYRLFQYSMNDVLHHELGEEQAYRLFRRAGHLAGEEYAKNNLPLDAAFNEFVAALQKSLLELKIGILRVEAADLAAGRLTLTVSEDLDCSGLPPSGEVVCNYDEGFIAGILETYAHAPFEVREIDCWATGDRVCRFSVIREDGQRLVGAVPGSPAER